MSKRRRKDADHYEEQDESIEEPATADGDQTGTDELARELQLTNFQAAVLEARTRKREQEWWATYKRSVPMIAELTDLDMAIAELRFREPHLSVAKLAKEIGVSTYRARQVLESPSVVEYLERRRLENRVSNNLHREKVLLGLLNEADRTVGGSSAARVRALELLGKELGMFTDRAEVNQRVSGSMSHDVDLKAEGGVYVFLPDNQRDPAIVGEPIAEPHVEGTGE